jgi:hypothetical protein
MLTRAGKKDRPLDQTTCQFGRLRWLWGKIYSSTYFDGVEKVRLIACEARNHLNLLFNEAPILGGTRARVSWGITRNLKV